MAHSLGEKTIETIALTKYAKDHRSAVTKTRAALGAAAATSRTAGGAPVAAKAPVAAANMTSGMASAVGSGKGVATGTRASRVAAGRRGVVSERVSGVGCFWTMLTVAGFVVLRPLAKSAQRTAAKTNRGPRRRRGGGSTSTEESSRTSAGATGENATRWGLTADAGVTGVRIATERGSDAKATVLPRRRAPSAFDRRVSLEGR